jgi:hypothetical protein
VVVACAEFSIQVSIDWNPADPDGVFCCDLVTGTKRRRDLMDTDRSTLQGLWLPLVTPFRDGALDEPSVRRLAAH